MKKIVFILFFSLLYRFSVAQLSSVQDPKYLAQIAIRSDEKMWWEAGFIYLGKNHINFQLKASVKKDFNYVDQNSTLYSNYKYTNYSEIGSVEYVSDFAYLKPGFIFLRKETRTRSFFLSLNGVLGFSKNKLVIHYIDPLLGEIDVVEKEDKVYKGLELETKFNFDLTRFMAVNFGASLGFTRAEDKLFRTVYDGAFKGRDIYSPGMGMNGNPYFSLTAGLLFKLH